MGLDLRRAGIVDEEEHQEGMQDAYTQIAEIKYGLEQRFGVSEPPRPKQEPVPLSEVDVSALSNLQLESLYLQYVSYSVFLNTKVAEIECLERAAGAELKKTRGRIENALRAGGIKEIALKAAVETHPAYLEAAMEYNKLYFTKKLSVPYYEVYSKQASGLSRAVELRKLEFAQQQRSSNLTRPSPRPRGAGKALRHKT